MSIISSILIQT